MLLAVVCGAACVCLWAPAGTADDAPMCADCHDDVAAEMAHQIHMRIKPFEVYGREVGCEGCHGDGTAHAEEGDPALIRTFSGRTAEDAEVCLDCHLDKGLPEWKASTHAIEGVYCFECHAAHARKNPLDSCQRCHPDSVAAFQLPSHHPVREGKMSCVSCHNSHAATEAMLRTPMRLNDLCYTCHQAIEGPFIFEHAPVGEDCRLCHLPHGSVANNLLTANEPTLCLQCHELHFHAGLLSPEGEIEVGGTHRENPFGQHSMNVAFTTKCSQCHHKVHGSDVPSQSLAGGGHGLVR
jgi:DmsE family decaheme c-type cytochrome